MTVAYYEHLQRVIVITFTGSYSMNWRGWYKYFRARSVHQLRGIECNYEWNRCMCIVAIFLLFMKGEVMTRLCRPRPHGGCWVLRISFISRWCGSRTGSVWTSRIDWYMASSGTGSDAVKITARRHSVNVRMTACSQLTLVAVKHARVAQKSCNNVR